MPSPSHSAPPAFLEAFKALVQERGETIELDSGTALLRFLHGRIVNRFGELFTDAPEDAVAAYNAERRREVPTLRVPQTGAEDLRAALLDYYQTLPAESRGLT